MIKQIILPGLLIDTLLSIISETKWANPFLKSAIQGSRLFSVAPTVQLLGSKNGHVTVDWNCPSDDQRGVWPTVLYSVL